MTRARPASSGVVTPPPLDRWIEAVLMLFVSLVHHAASLLRMGRIRLPAECHSDVTHPSLPEGESGLDKKEPLEAPGEGRDPASARSALFTRTSLTTVIPGEAGHPGLDPGKELEPGGRARGRLRLAPLGSASHARAP